MKGGEPTLLAAINGSREIGFAVIATTLVLVAVILPVSFMPGNIGLIFGEFGISLAAAVIFSSLIALTLVPMLTSKMFADDRLHRGRVARSLDRFYGGLSNTYERLVQALAAPSAARYRVFPAHFRGQSGLLPVCRSSTCHARTVAWVMINLTAPDGASLDYTLGYIKQAEAIALQDKAKRATSCACSAAPAAGVVEPTSTPAW